MHSGNISFLFLYEPPFYMDVIACCVALFRVLIIFQQAKTVILSNDNLYDTHPHSF